MLSVVIVNYRSSKLLLDCIHSFYKEYNDINACEIIIADNSPGDGAKEKLQVDFPGIRWLTMPGNLGFARANNAAIKVAQGDAVLLLNPDTLIIDNAIVESYHRLMESGFVACGVQLLNANGSPQISGNYALKGGLNYLMLIPYLGSVLRWIALHIGFSKPNLPQAIEKVTEVDWINGAYLMVKKASIEKAGLLDEDFFLYHEESEWCSRLRKEGPLCIYGDLFVTHLEGQAANTAFKSQSQGYGNLSDRKGYQLMLSMFVRIRKEFGLGWFLFQLLAFTLSLPFSLAISVLHSLIALSFQHMKSVGSYAANVIRCWKYLPVLVPNKPHFYKVL